nr:MAG TPA: hypothetical protein [Caudoviricetes sp.]
MFLLPHKKALLYPSRTAGLCRFFKYFLKIITPHT